jgi:NADH-quinone oxidoreductase subunit I
MNALTSTLWALWTTLRQLVRRPITVQFPEEVRARPERFRSSFALLHDEHGEELCIGCLMCERICPSSVITIVQAPKRESAVTGKKRGFAADFVLDGTACIYCELCVQVCPEDAIVMTKECEIPAFAREDLVLTMARLYENEKGKTHAWGTGTRLMAMHEPVKELKKAVVKPAAPVAVVVAELVPAVKVAT